MQHEQIPVGIYTQQAYHTYATYVILDRAIPRLEDGLKPVQRRILYAMSELGLKANSKPKKAVRTVGDVLGKFHPHSDAACYEAMVLMAQPFSFRYPYLNGQGNWGAIDDPKSFASMRYTEANLSIYAPLLLDDLNSHTTEWGPNFDGTLKEPLVLPAKLPTILLNGSSGIAVGIATDIPPFNLIEITNACIALLKKPSLSLEELVEVVPGPDYPTGAEIINSPKELKEIMQTGWGQIKQRAILEKDDNRLIITALPFQTTTSRIIQQIADLMVAKKLPMVKNIRDEADENSPISIVLTLRSNRVKEEEVLPILFSETDLEKGHKVNITYINPERKPVQTGILPLLKQWLVFHEDCFLRQLNHQLETEKARLHIIDGLLLVFDNIDEVIKIIRYDDDPFVTLQKTFSLSEQQARAILEMKLKHLAKLEVEKLEEEHKALAESIANLTLLIETPSARKKEMTRKFKALIKQYGDERRTQLVERKASQKISIVQSIPNDPCFIVLSKKGWIRAAKSHDFDLSQLTFKAGDKLEATTIGYTDNPTLLFDESGFAYSLPTHELPSIRGQGEPITKYIAAPKNLSPFIINNKMEQPILLISSYGYGFISSIQSLYTRNKAGKKVLSLSDASIAVVSELSEESSHIALVSQQGRLLVINRSEIPLLAKGKGNKLLNLHKKDLIEKTDGLVFSHAFKEDQTLVLTAGKRSLKLSPSEWQTYLGTRGQRGLFLPRGFRRVSQIDHLD